MILRHLRYFTVVADEGSVAKAAKRLRLGQPALSRQMQSLEHAVGFPLLHRDPRGVRLTAAGAVFLCGVNTLLGRLAMSADRARRSQVGLLGRVRIALNRGALQDARVGAALSALRDEYPDVEVCVSEMPTLTHVTALLAEATDVAVGLGLPVDKAPAADKEAGVRSETLYAEPIDTVLLAKGHPLASRGEIRPEDLRGEPLLLLDPHVTPIASTMARELERLGLTVAESHTQIESIWHLVAAGRGWTIAPASSRAHPPAGTAAVAMRGVNVPMSMMVRWRRADSTPVTHNVVSMLLRAASSSPRRRRPAPSRFAAMPGAEIDTVSPQLEMRAIRALLAAVEEGSLSTAARRLQLTQSAVSRQIRALEEALGVPLLERDANGVVATPAGDVIASDAREALGRFEHVLMQARRVHRGFSGVCQVGSIATELSQNILLAAIRTASEHLPNIAIEVTEIISPRQSEALASGRIDLGLALAAPGLVQDRAVASLRIAEDTLDCALLSSAHPLAARARVKPEELAALPFLFVARHINPSLYDHVLFALEEIGLTPRIDETHNGPRTQWRLVAEGQGWAIGPRSVRMHPIPGITAVPVEGLNLPSGLDLLWRRNESDASVLAVLEVFKAAGVSARGTRPDAPSAPAR